MRQKPDRADYQRDLYSAPEIARVRDRKNRLNLAWEVIKHPDRFKKAA
ncbi:MAG: hypothetical protein WBY44_08080 [Bryobacteraceae bacterium]